jgi:pSer/pThr/pTyr-binding forkhead associated (FHA) protein
MARPLSNGVPPKGEPKVEPKPKGSAEPKTMAEAKTVVIPREEKKEFGTLTLNMGDQLGKSYTIGEKGLIIGRDPAQCDIVILDPNVSRVHAWVTLKKGEVVIIDRGSTNGTYLNQVKVENATLKPGDIIQLGRKCNTTLVFNL